jgi:integrase
MFHLFTSLDGKDAPNPLRNIPPPRQTDPEPRALPYPLIEAIFDAMPDRRYGRKLTAEQVETVRTRAGATAANRSAIGRDFGISETMVRKILAGRYGHHDTAALTKARLRVAAYVGLPKAQIERLQPEHVNMDDPSVLVLGRRKGKGTRTVRLPLAPQGAEALRHFFAVGATGPYSASSAGRTWWRGIRTMVDRLALTDWRAAKLALDELRAFRARPHDLRHSMLTAVYLATGDIRATQAFALHADGRQTQRYTLAAVDPRLKALAAALRL